MRRVGHEREPEVALARFKDAAFDGARRCFRFCCASIWVAVKPDRGARAEVVLDVGDGRRDAVVVELVDARLPRSSRNPLLGQLAEGKPVLTLFTKSDLADESVTQEWLDAWDGPRPLDLVMTDQRSVKRIPARCRELAPNRGGPGRTLKILIVGIPNVGKSTLINSLTGRKIAKVGDRPAVTRRAQRVELDHDLSIFDSPGVWRVCTSSSGTSLHVRCTACVRRGGSGLGAGIALHHPPPNAHAAARAHVTNVTAASDSSSTPRVTRARC